MDIQTWLIEKVGVDKLLHFLLFALVMSECMRHTDTITAITITVLGIVGKELFDKYVRHTVFSWGDVLAGVIGMLVGVW